MRIAPLLFAAALLGGSCPAFAGDLAGKVYNSRGGPVAGIAVRLGEGERVARTDATGRYVFSDVAPGEHGLAIALDGGDTQRVWAQVPAAGDGERNIFLLGAGAIDRALAASFASAAAGPAMDEAAFARTLDLAESLIRENDARAQEWRWRDLDG